MTSKDDLRVAVIGAGPAGLAAAHELKEQGFNNFKIFEKASAVGGTWHLHTYPGLACDLWAHSYTFSYRPNPDWSASFVDQPEIEAYLQQCAREFGLEPHLELNTRIARAEFESDKYWRLSDDTGKVFEADVIINSMGNQHTPQYPDVAGIESFEGDYFHGTRWRHDIEMLNKRVAIIGSAASAIQITPELAKVANHLTVLQRTPNWIMSRGKKPYSERIKSLFNRFPSLLRLYRKMQDFMMGMVLDGVTIGHKRMAQFEAMAHKFIDQSIDDETLRERVRPSGHYGCKRGLVSDDFYPALQRDNVELVAEGLQAVRPTGITTTSGREIDVDAIIYCTGYRMMDYDRIEVIGLNDLRLADAMAQSPQAYKGIAAPNFPNYFFAAGPNALAINVSYFTNVERNAKTIVNLLSAKQQYGWSAMQVKEQVSREYNAWLSTKFDTYSWGNPSCNSYYRTADGFAPFLFPGGIKEYKALHDATDLQDFEPV